MLSEARLQLERDWLLLQRWVDDPSNFVAVAIVASPTFAGIHDQLKVPGPQDGPPEMDLLAQWTDNPAPWLQVVFNEIIAFPSAYAQLGVEGAPDAAEPINLSLFDWSDDVGAAVFPPVLFVAFDVDLVVPADAQMQVPQAPDAPPQVDLLATWVMDAAIWRVLNVPLEPEFLGGILDQQRLWGEPDDVPFDGRALLRFDQSVEWFVVLTQDIAASVPPLYQQLLEGAPDPDPDISLYERWLEREGDIFAITDPINFAAAWAQLGVEGPQDGPAEMDLLAWWMDVSTFAGFTTTDISPFAAAFSQSRLEGAPELPRFLDYRDHWEDWGLAAEIHCPGWMAPLEATSVTWTLADQGCP